MEKYITDERTGLRYELVGDYYLVAGDDEPAPEPIGIWGQRRRTYLRGHRQPIYTGLLLSGKLNAHLAEIDQQAETMFLQLVAQMAEREGVTEQLKARDQMRWVGLMNSIRNRATEVVNFELIRV